MIRTLENLVFKPGVPEALKERLRHSILSALDQEERYVRELEEYTASIKNPPKEEMGDDTQSHILSLMGIKKPTYSSSFIEMFRFFYMTTFSHFRNFIHFANEMKEHVEDNGFLREMVARTDTFYDALRQANDIMKKNMEKDQKPRS